jgi:starch phosphorylase
MIIPNIENPVAYFCNEFAIDNELPTYSGGLGILAGDIMNEAAFENYPMIGVGILYKGKDFIQHITGEGKVQTRDSEFDHDTSFLRPTTENGNAVIIDLNFGNLSVKVKSYHLRLADKTILFLLSTDIDGNPPEWVSDMDALYHGDTESLFRQQLLLGIGGVKLIDKLGIKPKVYHMNEGRPELLIWELTKQTVLKDQIDFDEAWKKAKEKIIYTNHTLVDAGNLTYKKDVVEKWANLFAEDLKIDANKLYQEGIDENSNFSSTLFALNIANKITAVSDVHAKYAQKKWQDYKFTAITNGINMNRWQDSDYRKNLTDRGIWDQHRIKKQELMKTVVKRTGFGYDPDRLVITWARRLAEYKQPKIIFSDIDRLKKIISVPGREVQILYAGNPHTGDANAKNIIEEIIKIFEKELSGYAIFVPNYNISLANHLTSGSDVWLNTPKGNLEACGTSGMKATANGILNCTILDGWTYEVDWDGIGWVLDPKNISESFYNQFENEIIPTYFERNEDGLPYKWIERMKKSIELSKKFSTEVMFSKYKKVLYN